MAEEVYKALCKIMAKRGGMFPGMDIPEFYELAAVLFTPQEAAVSNVMPHGFSTAAVIAEALGKRDEEITPVLEEMADKGLCFSDNKDGVVRYAGPPVCPRYF